MKNIFIIIILLALGCGPAKEKRAEGAKPAKHEKIDDSDPLRPEEGYNNESAQRKNKEKAENEMKLLKTKPAPCVTVESVDSVTVTANTATIKYPSYSGINKYYIYRSSVSGQTGVYDGQSTSSTYTGSGLSAGQTVYYTVAAIGRGNKVCEVSPQRRMTTAVTPQPPPPTGDINLVYLQFKPCTINNSAWSGSPIVSPGSGLTEQQELDCFEHAKAIYAEDHPWITFTMDQALYDATPADRKVMVVYTTNSSWYGSAGGVAYVNSYGTANGVCWVFTQLLNFSTRNVGLADIHEIGHTFGLYHTVTDTVCVQQYGLSVLCKDSVWRAPIMGGSYTPYPHIFWTPTKGNLYGVLWKQRNDCVGKDEDAIIDSKRK